jgi:hypothetical protein
MKRIISFAILFAIFFTGCEPMEKFQINPDEATVGNPALFLTATERNLFVDVLASDPLYGENPFLAARQWVGSNFHGEPYQYFRWAAGTFNKYNYLRNVQEIDKWSGGNQSYRGLAKLFRALYFYDMTMRFGDIPYSDALKLSDGTEFPIYDTQKEVFLGILNELEEANTLLTGSSGVISGDFIYQGNVLKWRKFVNSFQIRVLLALSKKAEDASLNVKGRFAKIMQDPQKYPLFGSNVDNAQRTTSLVSPSPYYSNSALIYMGLEQEFTEALKARRDPRLKYYAEITSKAASQGKSKADFDAYAGLPGGAPNELNTTKFNEVSIPNRNYTNVVNYEPMLYLGYYEVNFLISEAIQRGWWAGNAKDYYEKGIRASMQYWNVTDAEIVNYINHPLVVFNSSNALEQIHMQKYYASHQNSGWESYYTIRRTGTPKVDLTGAGMVERRMSVRWRYPQNEYLLNKGNVEKAVARQYPSGDDIYGTMWILQ